MLAELKAKGISTSTGDGEFFEDCCLQFFSDLTEDGMTKLLFVCRRCGFATYLVVCMYVCMFVCAPLCVCICT